MTDSQTISWIFLAIALATNTKTADINAISAVADGINHAVPTEKELSTSIAYLINKDFIMKEGQHYKLTAKGKIEYENASKDSVALLTIWKNLEITTSSIL